MEQTIDGFGVTSQAQAKDYRFWLSLRMETEILSSNQHDKVMLKPGDVIDYQIKELLGFAELLKHQGLRV